MVKEHTKIYFETKLRKAFGRAEPKKLPEQPSDDGSSWVIELVGPGQEGTTALRGFKERIGRGLIYRGEVYPENVRDAIITILGELQQNLKNPEEGVDFDTLYRSVANSFNRPQFNSYKLLVDEFYKILLKTKGLQFKKRRATHGEVTGFDEETGLILSESPQMWVITRIRLTK
jgi:hypothetical protein